MDVREFRRKAKEVGFVLSPAAIPTSTPWLRDFVNYDECTPELKLRLIRLCLIRCFPSNYGVVFPGDAEWLISGLMVEGVIYKSDYYFSQAVDKSIKMILSENAFVDSVIGCAFMFTVIDFQLRFIYGYRPLSTNPDNENYHKKYRSLKTYKLFDSLKFNQPKLDLEFSIINKYNLIRANKRMYDQYPLSIKQKFIQNRNLTLHGENYSATYGTAYFLCLLFFLINHFTPEE